MASKRQSRAIAKQKIPGRSDRILALVPRRGASSDGSGTSDSENELHVSSDSSSPAPSICSSLLNLNIDENSDDDFNHEGNNNEIGTNPTYFNDKNHHENNTSESHRLTPEINETVDVQEKTKQIPTINLHESDRIILIPNRSKTPNEMQIEYSSENKKVIETQTKTSEVLDMVSQNPEKKQIVETAEKTPPLSPILEKICPNQDIEPDYYMIPSISSLPSLPSVEPSTPDSSWFSKPKRQKRQTVPTNKKLQELSNTRKDELPNQSFTRRKSAVKRTSPISPLSNSSPSSSRPVLQAKSRNTRSKCKNTTVTTKKVKKIKKTTLNYAWKKAVFNHIAHFESNDEDYEDIVDIDSALDLFFLFFSPDILTDIVEQTNAYALYKIGRSINFTLEELRDFLAILIIMGIVEMPSYCDYWSKKFRYPMVADIMTLKRFQQVRRYLHFTDASLDSSDRYCKVRPLLEKIRANCLAQERGNKFSIDEMMVPYKGKKAGNRRQYMKDKPNKWGFKNYVRAGVSGIIYDFVLYGGEDTFRFHRFTQKEASIGFGAQIVIALCKSIKHKPASVYCDNFFSSPELFHILREDYGIFGLGTIRGNRIRGAEKVLPTDKEMKKKPRGNYAQVVSDQKLAIVKWCDNKVVTFVSSSTGIEPVEKIKRYCKNAKQKVNVDCPQVVKEYNKHMGGVDLADMLISLYKIPFKCRRWYMPIFVQMLDICINNAWILGRQKKATSGAIPLKSFRLELYHGLLQTNRSAKRAKNDVCDTKNPSRPRPVDSVRYDEVGHFPSIKTEGRCCLCTKNTTVFCIKCDFRMCFVTGKNPRNCFLAFHTK